ncbi:MAG: NAD(P)H-dependent oxidoreductase [Granulosicoccus sp.]|nr:NAD(P)H-dependent oxidoreductase [Granulosicoccus sp.]
MQCKSPETTLIVLAHPEPRSFNGAWAQASVEASEAIGHKVLYADLVSMGFDPVEKASHYRHLTAVDLSSPFDPLLMQELAAREQCLPADVAPHVLNIRSAQRIIFHFPLWWFGPPAVLKGWLDRCLVHGELHTNVQRFDAGSCVGKKAIFCVSTGSTAMESSPAGKEGHVTMLLWPLAYSLRYLGFTVLQPKIVHGVHGYHQDAAKTELENRLRRIILEQRELISEFDDWPIIQFNRDDDFDENGVLRPSAASHSSFIRHRT